MLRFSVIVFLISGLLCALAVYSGSHLFYSIFNPEDTQLIEFATARSNVHFSLFFATGFNILMISFWQATGKTGKSLAVSLSRSLILPPLFTAVLPFSQRSIHCRRRCADNHGFKENNCRKERW